MTNGERADRLFSDAAPIADEMPSIAIAREKIQPIATSPPSPMPKCSANGFLKTENAYA